jgi:Zn-dependent protease
VPIDPGRFRADVTMGNGLLLTAAAGPMSNLILAMLCAAALRLADCFPGATLHPSIEFLLSRSATVNVALALFNLLPIPPLDGSRIVDGLIPFAWRGAWNRISGAGAVLLLALFVAPHFFGFGIDRWMSELTTRLTGR